MAAASEIDLHVLPNPVAARIRGWIEKDDKYHYLNLANLNLSEISSELCQIMVELGVKRLSLICNELEFLPPELGQLTNLQSLSISDNKLKNLPVELGQLENLTYFNCNSNYFNSPLLELIARDNSIGIIKHLREELEKKVPTKSASKQG